MLKNTEKKHVERGRNHFSNLQREWRLEEKKKNSVQSYRPPRDGVVSWESEKDRCKTAYSPVNLMEIGSSVGSDRFNFAFVA